MIKESGFFIALGAGLAVKAEDLNHKVHSSIFARG